MSEQGHSSTNAEARFGFTLIPQDDTEPPKRVRECDLYPPIRDWLRARGYEVHVEVFGVDVVGIKGDEMFVVELKKCMTMRLYSQLGQSAAWADYVAGAIASDPREISNLKYHGYGLLIVQGGKVRMKLKPQPQPHFRFKMRRYRLKQLTGRAPAMEHELAGLPSCPALREQRRLRSAPTQEKSQ